mmetsp:Transcript_126827/g.370797  ORF Transcript_126827/g.370797 Transcript_126827/m.370797 type:complete len:228 (+) Transcript_126827:77-760(+)
MRAARNKACSARQLSAASRGLLGAPLLLLRRPEVVLRHERAHGREEVRGGARHLPFLVVDPALQHANRHGRPAHPGAQLTHLAHNAHALQHGPKNDMVPIVHTLGRQRDHELRAVRVLPPVDHGEVPVPQEFHVKVLVRKGLAVDAEAVGLARAQQHVPAHDAGARLYQVELRVSVANHLVVDPVALAELQEVLTSERYFLAIETDQHPANIPIPNANVHEDLVADH